MSKTRERKVLKPNRKRPPDTELPDLQPILDAYLDAYAILRTASYALHAGDEDDRALAANALRQGIEGLDVANDRLEEAEMQLGRFDLEMRGVHG